MFGHCYSRNCYKRQKTAQPFAVSLAPLQSYFVVWHLVRPSLPLATDLDSTLNAARNYMRDASGLGMIAGHSVIFPSYEAVQTELNELTRSYMYFVSCVRMVVPADQLIKKEGMIYLKYLPDPFQLLTMNIPAGASFNNFMATQEEINVDNPIYTQLADNIENIFDALVGDMKIPTPHKQAKKYLDIEHATDFLVYYFFAKETPPKNRLIIRCILEKMDVDIAKVYQKLVKTDKEISTAQTTLSLKLPTPVIGIVQDYLSGIPRL